MPKKKSTDQLTQTLQKSWLLPVILFVVGVSSSVLWGSYTILQYRSMVPNAQHLQKEVAEPTADTAALSPVQITAKNFSVPVSPIFYRNNDWHFPSTTAGHITSSGYPTQDQNIVLYGYNSPEILGGLTQLKRNDTITLTLNNGEERSYKIFNTVQVTPDNIQYLWPRQNEVLTVYTSAGFLNKDRFIVQAAPLQIDTTNSLSGEDASSSL